MANKKILPKTQAQLSQATITPYDKLNQGKSPLQTPKKRGEIRSVKNDDVKQFHIGLRDIDETIVYYFNQVIKPSVVRNGKRVNVPILYGSPERWASVQKDGFYRDKNGKIQTPLIMFKRDSVEKNRQLGNKLDANLPNNFGIFKKKFSKKNVYDRFSALTNRNKVEEYYGVIIPDYVNISYSCVIFTEYVEQMNKIVESINFASDSYWGDPEKFKFRAMIDTYTTTTEMVQGQDRMIKTNFSISLLGHIVPDSINTSIANMNKLYSKSAINFTFETAGSEETLSALASTPAREAKVRQFDGPGGKTTINQTVNQTIISGSGMTDAERDYASLSVLIDTNQTGSYNSNIDVGNNKVTYIGVTIADAPTGFPALTVDDFQVYINGLNVEPAAITSIAEVSGNTEIVFIPSELGYGLNSEFEITAVGKFEF
tara:strand:+ start:2360 stop:3646 length:1287 start_codon:yes stop_codon:yes gene_type:complete